MTSTTALSVDRRRQRSTAGAEAYLPMGTAGMADTPGEMEMPLPENTLLCPAGRNSRGQGNGRHVPGRSKVQDLASGIRRSGCWYPELVAQMGKRRPELRLPPWPSTSTATGECAS